MWPFPLEEYSVSTSRYKMKTLNLVFLCFLGVFSYQIMQVSYAAESYSTYYAELIMESSALPNITEELASHRSINVLVDKTATLKYVNITTECRIDNDKTNCTCKGDFIWSNDVCSFHPHCCTMEYCIMKTANLTPMCIPKLRVTVTGSITLQGEYQNDLADSNSEIFKFKSVELTNFLKKAFSELSGFDSLAITQFRKGSIIADFQMIVNAPFTSNDLSSKTRVLKENLTADIFLETKGLVIMEMPNMPVCFGCGIEISCEFQEVVDSTWQLRKEGIVKIVNGTEVTIKANGRISNLSITKASAIWKGSYECIFRVNNIDHKACKELDIALLPETVDKILDPQFPDCLGKPDKMQDSKITYKIKNDSENYMVYYGKEKITPIGQGKNNVSSDFIIYEVNTKINCTTDKDPVVELLFKNRLNNTLQVSATIPVIRQTPYCEADKEWPKAKNGYKATLTCSDDNVGHRERNCSDSGQWKDEISYCVNLELHSLLQDALSIGKGQGSVQDKGEELFKRMKNATSHTNEINTYANINASVNILSVMSDASDSSIILKPLKFETLKDVLHSASNMLNESLNTSWTPKSNSETNYNLTATYLKAVEGLSNQTNITGTDLLNYTNVEFFSCHFSMCDVKVFNVSVSMKGSNISGTMRTIGFKNLADLLPNDQMSDTEPSSIVVSATWENQYQKSPDISLTFLLNKKRPRNHKAHCVFWDFLGQKWSTTGCVLKKTNLEDKVVCECSHLTSFSTLMSKYPVHLPFLSELTYIGLGVSIFSLAICLMIELIVWNSVVKSNIAHFRHMALVNISLCLLLADCCFLANTTTGNLCLILVLLKHFCYLAMFFWMLCLSIMLLHKLIFVFHQVRRKVYLAFSFSLGYVCPAVIVLFSYIYYDNGKLGSYYNDDCWLNYDGILTGSIHAFILPVGVIIFINIFSLAVVISKLLQPSVSEGNKGDEKDMVKSILKAVVFFTPIFGMTWILGFVTMTVDLADGVLPIIIHYLFTLLNAFQGIFILLTGCFGEKKVREALLIYLNPESKSARSETSSRLTCPKK
ncbi:adhesion G-protein coupled receptor F1-like isoform X1 [Anguilla rostrata]|uniref:adhesion G-protein coupled receptor F1-like isoform X1 n=1 Tax=Anguilla rostrata TaxID=7938 RepID=UPI0030D36599